MAVVEALAQVADVDPRHLTPLHDAIDPDALDRLTGPESAENTVLAFSVDEWNVFVRGNGRIRICDATIEVETAPVFDRPVP